MCTKLKSWKSYVWTDVAVQTSSWSRDDNRLVEFLTIHMLLTPMLLVLVLQDLISPSFKVVNTLVSRHDKSFVVHLLDPAIKQCLTGTLRNFGVQYKWERFLSSSDISNPTDFINLQWLFRISSNESVDGIYVELGVTLVVLMPNSFIKVSK